MGLLSRLRQLLQSEPDCYCGYRIPEQREWDYHTPTGCATTREGLEEAQERSQRLPSQ